MTVEPNLETLLGFCNPDGPRSAFERYAMEVAAAAIPLLRGLETVNDEAVLRATFGDRSKIEILFRGQGAAYISGPQVASMAPEELARQLVASYALIRGAETEHAQRLAGLLDRDLEKSPA